MRCETCQGQGKVTYDKHPEPKPTQFGSVFLCPDCGGSGVSHCCDGLTACNDPPRPDFVTVGDVGYQRTGNVRS